MAEMIRATVKVAGRQRERRFPAKTPKRLIEQWRTRKEAELKKRFSARAARGPAPGTVAADIERVLPQRKELASWTDYCANLRAWVPFIGTLSREAVEKSHIRTARGQWLEAGAAARTVNNRVSALRQFYKILDGEDAPTPCDGLKWLKPPKPAKQLVPVDIVNRVCGAAQASPAVADRHPHRPRPTRRPACAERPRPADGDGGLRQAPRRSRPHRA
jgi:hypothetical protein